MPKLFEAGVLIRCSPKQLREWKRAAKRRKFSLSEWIRTSLSAALVDDVVGTRLQLMLMNMNQDHEKAPTP